MREADGNVVGHWLGFSEARRECGHEMETDGGFVDICWKPFGEVWPRGSGEAVLSFFANEFGSVSI